MKKLLAFGVASVMALSLAACGGASSTAASSEAADTASSEAATTEATGKKWTISLQNTCLKCHSNYEEFCDKCHVSNSVDPYCWTCHILPKGNK